MPWLKYRIRYGYGNGDTMWRLIERYEDAEIEIEGIKESADDGGHMYRGVDWSVISVAPKWIVESNLRAATEDFRDLEKRIMQLDQDLAKAIDCETCGPYPIFSSFILSSGTKTCPDCGRGGVLFKAMPNALALANIEK